MMNKCQWPRLISENTFKLEITYKMKKYDKKRYTREKRLIWQVTFRFCINTSSWLVSSKLKTNVAKTVKFNILIIVFLFDSILTTEYLTNDSFDVIIKGDTDKW